MAVDETSKATALGRLFFTQFLHCASACGCEQTLAISVALPLLLRSAWDISSITSAHIFRFELTNLSSVWLTTPSVEFSMGTTPKSALPFSTSSKTSAMSFLAMKSPERPKCCMQAWCVNVAAGPRNAILKGFSRDKEALIISLKTFLSAWLGNGPLLASVSLFNTSRSLSGT